MVAGLLDQVVALLPFVVLAVVRPQHLVRQAVNTSLILLALSLYFLAAPISLWVTNGRTAGRKLLGIRVVRGDGMRMTLGRVLRRELGGIGRGASFTALLSLASMGTDSLRRSGADRRAGTVVVIDDR